MAALERMALERVSKNLVFCVFNPRGPVTLVFLIDVIYFNALGRQTYISYGLNCRYPV